MGAPAAGVAGRAERFAGAGEAGQFVGVRLDQVGAGSQAAPQGLAAGVQEYGDACGAGPAYEVRVGADRDSGRQAAAERHRVRLAQQRLVRREERLPLVGRDLRARLVELGGVAGGRVHDRDRAAGGPGDRDQRVDGRERREQFTQHRAGAAAREARDDALVAERGQHPGDVESLAAGALGDLVHAVAGVRDELRDPVGEVEGRVQRDGQDHEVIMPNGRW